MIHTKSIWLPLTAVCLNGGSTESRLLRASVKENTNTVCLTVEQCRHKFLSLDTGGYFASGSFPCKGCYMKNNNIWFGSGGTDEEMLETDLPGIITRVWCDMEVGTPTFTVAEISEPFASGVDSPTSEPTSNQVATIRTKRATPQPSKHAPTDMSWNHGSTTAMTSNGTIELRVPQNAQVGDALFLFMSRTDGYLPLRLDQWTNVAQCFKSSNEQPECLRADDCLKEDGIYCRSFAKGRGKDLGTAAFYRILTQEDKEGGGRGWRFWAINLEGRSTAWTIITAIAGVNDLNPVLGAVGASCDKESGSAFPSVYGEENDILLLSQSFDDNAKESHFQPPNGTSLLGWITSADEAGFVFGERLIRQGETGKLTTAGPGGRRNDPPGVGATKTLSHYRDCKDAMLSVIANRAKP